MIEAAGVSLTYPDGTLALKNFDLQVEPGAMVYITGPSGSGKTSLLKLLLGIEYPTTGSLKVAGKSITKSRAADIRRLRRIIGPIFQEFRLLKGRTAMENVILGMRFLDLPRGCIKENAGKALSRVGLERKAFSLVENLSLGEQQRVAIARAVARQPLLILADEPTGNLDKENAQNILELLTSFRDKNTTVMVTTHAVHLINREKGIKLITIENGSMKQER
jgi:cell division transport system ATP-binding protein